MRNSRGRAIRKTPRASNANSGNHVNRYNSCITIGGHQQLTKTVNSSGCKFESSSHPTLIERSIWFGTRSILLSASSKSMRQAGYFRERRHQRRKRAEPKSFGPAMRSNHPQKTYSDFGITTRRGLSSVSSTMRHPEAVFRASTAHVPSPRTVAPSLRTCQAWRCALTRARSGADCSMPMLVDDGLSPCSRRGHMCCVQQRPCGPRRSLTRALDISLQGRSSKTRCRRST